MTRLNFSLLELSRSEVVALEYTAQILIYNEASGMYSLSFADKNCPARSKNDCSHLRFFLFAVAPPTRS